MRRYILFLVLLYWQSAFAQKVNMLIKTAYPQLRLSDFAKRSAPFTLLLTNTDDAALYKPKKESFGYVEDFPNGRISFGTAFKSLDSDAEAPYVEYNDRIAQAGIPDSDADPGLYNVELLPGKLEVIKCNPFEWNGHRGPGWYEVIFYVTYFVPEEGFYRIGKSFEFLITE